MKADKLKLKKMAVLGIFSAIGLIIGFLESLMPPILPFLPFAKLGFSNIVVLFTLVVYGVGEGFLVLGIRCLVLGLIAGNPIMILYSLGGGLLSLFLMFFLLRLNKTGLIAISSAGGAIHGFGQIAVGSAFAGSAAPFFYLPHLCLFGAIAGAITGALVLLLVKKIPSKLIYNKSE